MTKPQLDDVIHAPKRLHICALLMPLEEAEFQVLRDELAISDSVLSKHLKKLEDAGYIKVRKGAMNGRQRMWTGLTSAGRKAFAQHVHELQRVVEMAGQTSDRMDG